MCFFCKQVDYKVEEKRGKEREEHCTRGKIDKKNVPHLRFRCRALKSPQKVRRNQVEPARYSTISFVMFTRARLFLNDLLEFTSILFCFFPAVLTAVPLRD